jgi:uncharacterized membrane-anchored protein
MTKKDTKDRNTLLEFSIVFFLIGCLMIFSSHLIIGGLICGLVFAAVAGIIVYSLHKKRELSVSLN